MKYYVKYKVPALQGQNELTQGPYETWQEAVSNRGDIAGYEGVIDVRIVCE